LAFPRGPALCFVACLGYAQPAAIVDLFLGPGRREIPREGAIPTHEIVMAL
jgi:hypothetical protein